MAIGLPPAYAGKIVVDDLTTGQLLMICVETAKKLDWKISYISPTGFIAATPSSAGSQSEETEIKITEGQADIYSKSAGIRLVDWGKNKGNIAHFILLFNDLKAAIDQPDLFRKTESLFQEILSDDNILTLPPAVQSARISGFLSLFRPVKGYFITPLLIDLNIAVFIIMILSGVNILFPARASLIRWGGNFRPDTLQGEWWRLLTCCFLHAGIFHLLMNMYALLFIGLLLEPYLGRLRFISAYLLTGIAASTASLWWHELTVSVGASGAIFGMYGLFLAMLTTNLIEKTTRKTLLISIAVFIGYNLLGGMRGNVDNAAHIGGLAAGILFGYAYFPDLKKPGRWNLKYITIGSVAFIILGVSFIVFQKLPNSVGVYEQKMESFLSMEAMALEVYRLPENTPKEKVLYELKERGIYYWKENIKLLKEIDTLKLPQKIHYRNKKFIQYCRLRIKSYELMCKTIRENTGRYDEELAGCNRQIDTLLTSLTGKRQRQGHLRLH